MRGIETLMREGKVNPIARAEADLAASQARVKELERLLATAREVAEKDGRDYAELKQANTRLWGALLPVVTFLARVRAVFDVAHERSQLAHDERSTASWARLLLDLDDTVRILRAVTAPTSGTPSFRQPLAESERNAIRASWGQKPLAEHVARCPRCGKGVGAKKDTDGAFRVLDHKRDIDEGRCSGVGQAVTEVVAI